MSSANEALSRRFFDELCNGRALDVADEIIAADFVSHIPQSPPAEGPDGVKASVAIYQDALDGHWDVQEMYCAGDRVFTRWIGRGTHVGEINAVAPTGNAIAVEALTMHASRTAASPRTGRSGTRSACSSRSGRSARRPERRSRARGYGVNFTVMTSPSRIA
jgi:ketosteroid isomerase-like protein